jgi:hypothetical protein
MRVPVTISPSAILAEHLLQEEELFRELIFMQIKKKTWLQRKIIIDETKPRKLPGQRL